MTEDPHRYHSIAPRAPEGRFRLDQLIEGDGPLELDIGFGRGASLWTRAETAPAARLVGIEIKAKWAYKVAERAKAEQPARVRVFAGDARELLSRADPDGCVHRAYVHFPDPWWKKRHRKRRVVDSPLLDELARLLMPGGELFVQTDVEGRALEYRAQIDAHADFELRGAEGWLDHNPFGAISNRECRAQADGVPVWRLLAFRVATR